MQHFHDSFHRNADATLNTSHRLTQCVGKIQLVKRNRRDVNTEFLYNPIQFIKHIIWNLRNLGIEHKKRI